MFIKFWDEDDNIVFWAIVALITMPIWGSIILLIQGAAEAYAWILEHQIVIYAILFGIIGITAIVSSLFALHILKKCKNISVPMKMYFTLIPCLGTVGTSFCLYHFIDIAQNANTTYTGLLLLFHFILWLVGSLIGFFVVVIGQIMATCMAANYYGGFRKQKKESYWIALIPFAVIAGYGLLNVVF